MNLNSLRAFVVLSQTRSFSRAAAELRTVQPSVSRHIKTLEQELGYSLFERARRQVQLTARGAEFLRAIGPSVMQIFSTLEQQVAHTLAPDWKGVISIASLHDAGVQFLWPALIEFKRRFPLVDFNVNLVSTQEVLRLLGTGEVSLSLTSQTPTHKRLTYQALRRDDLVAIQGARTRGFEHKPIRVITYRKTDLATSQFFSRNLSRREAKAVEFCGAINSHTAIVRMVEEFPYVAVVPRIAVAGEIDLGRVLVAMTDKQSQTLNLVTTAAELQHPQIQALWDHLTQIPGSSRK